MEGRAAGTGALDSFLHVLAVQCSQLEDRLAEEYRQVFRRLEAEVARLRLDNERLQQLQGQQYPPAANGSAPTGNFMSERALLLVGEGGVVVGGGGGGGGGGMLSASPTKRSPPLQGASPRSPRSGPPPPPAEALLPGLPKEQPQQNDQPAGFQRAPSPVRSERSIESSAARGSLCVGSLGNSHGGADAEADAWVLKRASMESCTEVFPDSQEDSLVHQVGPEVGGSQPSVLSLHAAAAVGQEEPRAASPAASPANSMIDMLPHYGSGRKNSSRYDEESSEVLPKEPGGPEVSFLADQINRVVSGESHSYRFSSPALLNSEKPHSSEEDCAPSPPRPGSIAVVSPKDSAHVKILLDKKETLNGEKEKLITFKKAGRSKSQEGFRTKTTSSSTASTVRGANSTKSGGSARGENGRGSTSTNSARRKQDEDESSERTDETSICSSDEEECFAVAECWLQMSPVRRHTQILQNKENAINKMAMSHECSIRSSQGGMHSTDSEWILPEDLDDMAFSWQRLSWWLRRHIIAEPYSRRQLCWEICSSLLVLYDIMAIPLEVFDPPESAFVAVATWVVRIWWTLDIFISFTTGYVSDQGTVVTKPSMVAKKYLRNQLFIDLLVVASDWTEVIVGTRTTGVFKARRMLRLTRLARLKKARETQEKLSEFFSAKVFVVASVVRLLAALLVLLHVLSCMWYGVSDNYQYVIGPGKPSWVEDMDLRQMSFGEKYLHSFHFASAIFWGEHTALPFNTVERVFIIMTLFFCFVLQIWLVSSITTSMTQLEIASARRNARFIKLERYMHNHNISRELTLKVTRNAKHELQEQERNAPESEIDLLQVISEPLFMELHYEIFSPSLFLHPFFKCYSVFNPAGIRKACHVAADLQHFSKGDIIFHNSETPVNPRVFFVVNGELMYIWAGDPSMRAVGCKNWISEAVLWVHSWIHMGTLRAETNCRLMTINALKFQEILGTFPSMEPVKYANRFTQFVNDQAPNERSDVGEYTQKLGGICENLFPSVWEDVRQMFEPQLTLNRSKMSKVFRNSTMRLSGFANGGGGVSNAHHVGFGGRRKLSSLEDSVLPVPPHRVCSMVSTDSSRANSPNGIVFGSKHSGNMLAVPGYASLPPASGSFSPQTSTHSVTSLTPSMTRQVTPTISAHTAPGVYTRIKTTGEDSVF
eukprot:TRINITY_DN1506_c1_g2_i5.p1 TRINITY_DN1506_c1_g2~~TRINITY_DN1506_c1_g2_i5.p1  ORF type:complete len:1166 (-),score=265.66 TRINITY_DN1506_c1_g2_i5:49-3546(-)